MDDSSFKKGRCVIDNHGVVHMIAWVSHARDITDFTVTCRAEILSIHTPYYNPTRQRPTCLRCLAES